MANSETVCFGPIPEVEAVPVLSRKQPVETHDHGDRNSDHFTRRSSGPMLCWAPRSRIPGAVARIDFRREQHQDDLISGVRIDDRPY